MGRISTSGNWVWGDVFQSEGTCKQRLKVSPSLPATPPIAAVCIHRPASQDLAPA